MNDDDQKHNFAADADEEVKDMEGPLGHAPEEVEDIDETLNSVGLPNDDKGPHELNSEEVIAEADKNQS